MPYTHREVYEFLVKSFKARKRTEYISDDKLSRAANIYAVKNTARTWREANETT